VPLLGVPLEETVCSCPSDNLQSRSEDVSLWGVVHSCVDRPWWSTTLIGWIRSTLGTWSSFSRADFSESTPALLLVAWALKLFRRRNWALSSTLQISSCCLIWCIQNAALILM
jgi:hypothetical protein